MTNKIKLLFDWLLFVIDDGNDDLKIQIEIF